MTTTPPPPRTPALGLPKVEQVDRYLKLQVQCKAKPFHWLLALCPCASVPLKTDLWQCCSHLHATSCRWVPIETQEPGGH